VYFPRAILPLASMLARGVDFLISAAGLAAILAYYGVRVTAYTIYIVPLLILQLALMVGVSLFLGALNAYYRDVRYVLPLAIQLWLYATPVVWSMDMVPSEYRLLYAAINPMAAVIDGFRGALLRASPPDPGLLAAGVASTLVLLVAAHHYFTRVQRNFADII